MGWRRRTAHDRAVAQWRAELDRRLDAGEDPWQQLGPQAHRLEGGLPEIGPSATAALPERPGRRRRRASGPWIPGLAVVVGLLGFVALSNPGSASYWAQEMVRRAAGDESTSYNFMRVDTTTGDPVAWDRCQPIRYVVNPAGAPRGWQQLVESATTEIRTASGFDLVDVGITDDTDFLERRPGAPVLVGWGTSTDWPQLSGDVAGFGGGGSQVVEDTIRFVSGEVLLDADHYAELESRGADDAMRQILVHELLHVLGLDHVDDPHELMYPSYEGQSLGPGDRAGLDRLGEVPCG